MSVSITLIFGFSLKSHASIAAVCGLLACDLWLGPLQICSAAKLSLSQNQIALLPLSQSTTYGSTRGYLY